MVDFKPLTGCHWTWSWEETPSSTLTVFPSYMWKRHKKSSKAYIEAECNEITKKWWALSTYLVFNIIYLIIIL